MNEKGSEEAIDGSRDEKVTQDDVKHEVVGDLGRRRKSVALNIVQNPLQVSFALSGRWLRSSGYDLIMLIVFSFAALHTGTDCY
jgi:hypothetical protein